MNVRKTGILIETGRPGLKVVKANSFNKQQEKKKFSSYIEMAHKDDEGATVVTPFAKHFLRAMEKQGYKISEDFEIYRRGDKSNDANRAKIAETIKAKAH